MNTGEAIRELRSGAGLVLSAGKDHYLLSGLSHVELLATLPLELWAADAFMIEGYTDPLSVAAHQLAGVAGSELVFEFEAWKRTLLPQWPEGGFLPFRIIEHEALRGLIARHRAPLLASRVTKDQLREIERNKGLPLHPLKIEGFQPLFHPQRIRFLRDGSFKILKPKAGT